MKKFSFKVYTSNQWSRLNVCHIDEHSKVDEYGMDAWDAYCKVVDKYQNCRVMIEGTIADQLDLEFSF